MRFMSRNLRYAMKSSGTVESTTIDDIADLTKLAKVDQLYQ